MQVSFFYDLKKKISLFYFGFFVTNFGIYGSQFTRPIKLFYTQAIHAIITI